VVICLSHPDDCVVSGGALSEAGGRILLEGGRTNPHTNIELLGVRSY